MIEKLKWGWIDPDTCIESNNVHLGDQNEENEYCEEEKEENEEEYYVNEVEEIELYNLSLTHEENFENGEVIKHILLPINRDGFFGNSFTPLTNAGSKIVMNSKKFVENSDYLLDFIVLDYDTMFGLRLLTFQRYDSTFFGCDERVFFETLLIKFHSFGFKPFFISYPTVQKELGIKKDRLITISNKFEGLGIVTKEIKKSVINGRPSQITYYNINADKVIELLPKIYINDYLSQIKDEMEKYLEPALNKKNNNEIIDIVDRGTW